LNVLNIFNASKKALRKREVEKIDKQKIPVKKNEWCLPIKMKNMLRKSFSTKSGVIWD